MLILSTLRRPRLGQLSRVRAKGWGGDKRNGDGLRTLYVEREGELLQPRTGKPQPPAPLLRRGPGSCDAARPPAAHSVNVPRRFFS